MFLAASKKTLLIAEGIMLVYLRQMTKLNYVKDILQRSLGQLILNFNGQWTMITTFCTNIKSSRPCSFS